MLIILGLFSSVCVDMVGVFEEFYETRFFLVFEVWDVFLIGSGLAIGSYWFWCYISNEYWRSIGYKNKFLLYKTGCCIMFLMLY